ncbi:uncharacterized protein LOC130782528 isoform X2 [Actinidia eriantha]|uniref:uncharacterized protein LOC130782528 isoform X2 n=1 Tax=Actinidia eriantha TaxID=165200 RepID=UPI0025829A9D|nr:uncharacterized protein LOC130782528 isoform X2 [Actinidia eriantha]
MGNKPSTIFRRVQPSLPYSSHYTRLLSPDSQVPQPLRDMDNQRQPLLDMDNQQPLLDVENNHDEFMEQMKLGIEANQRENESLEKKKAAALEEEVGELNGCVSKQESTTVEKNVAALEKEIRQLKSSISILESWSHPASISVHGSIVTGSDAALKKEVDKLAHRVMQLELDSLMSVRKQDVEKVERKNAELEKRLAKLTTTMDQLTSTPSEQESHLKTAIETQPEVQSHETDDLVGCLIVLIFLVSVLIGVSI